MEYFIHSLAAQSNRRGGNGVTDGDVTPPPEAKAASPPKPSDLKPLQIPNTSVAPAPQFTPDPSTAAPLSAAQKDTAPAGLFAAEPRKPSKIIPIINPNRLKKQATSSGANSPRPEATSTVKAEGQATTATAPSTQLSPVTKAPSSKENASDADESSKRRASVSEGQGKRRKSSTGEAPTESKQSPRRASKSK